jgi:membrane-bound ClpP family serine protease
MISVLLTVAFVLFFIEILIPGGFLAIAGVVLIVIATVLCYEANGLLSATLFLLGSSFGAFVLFLVELQVLSKTRVGKLIRLDHQVKGSSLEAPGDDGLIGKTGLTTTPMNPSGKVRIDGRSYQGKSENGWLPTGTPVQVIRREIFHVIVTKTQSNN